MVTLTEARANRTVKDWVAFFKAAEIPVLRQTAREIAQLQAREDETGARDITRVVINDPLMMFKVLAYANNHRSRHQLQDLVQVEQAIIMMGTGTFFAQIPTVPHVEDVLHEHMSALIDLLKLMIRAHRAGYFSAEFASHLMDLHAEEVRVAASLHDFAEMLMWCFNPDAMGEISQRQDADKTLRSRVVQQEVLGFRLLELQAELVQVFNLPPLLSDLMDEARADLPRVRNVQLAVNLARHSADGWDNAALPDDYKDIAELLHVDVERVKHIVGVPQH
ncbi:MULTISPECIES: HDOD domain-containing protein [unclassified Methylophilus]|jgi:HD-like signal output (HDOD) protein|uniref:HDOD domain-containing protein n=1 Tax=Methylophilus glucosoxydans TaxID=752553 RepID=A0ABW3GHI6_9PROT|nr:MULTISPECIES: HDOD domain-containing protein [unclassified Methylophilus]MDF0377156.1 HDOD domain-containing protein [Methylophilus sp. YYY-1]MDT7850220.1 HDOD domain-containing protein [Methylophilus sp. VKM B-3414]